MNKNLLKVCSLAALGLALFACGGEPSTSTPAKPSTAATAEKTYVLKTGSYVGKMEDPAGYVTNYQVEFGMASVIIEKDTNKVVDAYFDVLQAPFIIEDNTVKISAKNNQTKEAGAKVIETKKELKERYAMANAATKGEWYVQAEAYEAWCVGQTLDAITAAVGTDGAATTEIVDAGCSIKVNNFVEALKGITDTKEFKSATKPEAGLGTIVHSFGSDGANVLTVTLGAAATAGNDTILEASLNAYQLPLKIDSDKLVIDTSVKQAKADTITKDAANKATTVTSKRELQTDYGMGSAPKGEWFEQADAYAEYAKGQSAATLEGYVHGGDAESPVAGCTITNAEFRDALKEAATDLK